MARDNKSVQWGTVKINYNIEEKLFGERFLKSVFTGRAESHGNEHQPNTVYQYSTINLVLSNKPATFINKVMKKFSSYTDYGCDWK